MRNVWGLKKIHRKISPMKVTKEVLVLGSNLKQDVGTSDVPYINTFQISKHHTYVATYDLSERWGRSLDQDTRAPNNIINKLFHSAIIPLARI